MGIRGNRLELLVYIDYSILWLDPIIVIIGNRNTFFTFHRFDIPFGME